MDIDLSLCISRRYCSLILQVVSWVDQSSGMLNNYCTDLVQFHRKAGEVKIDLPNISICKNWA